MKDLSQADRLFGAVAFVCYVATIFLANAAIQSYGLVPVGFGLLAPAGVYFAGLAFTLRDITHEKWGPVGSIVAVIIGAVLSYWVSPAFAYASGFAFLASEILDLGVYMWFRPKGFWIAVLLSNVAGFILDSFLFLLIAFGNLEFLPGQIVGKAWVTLIAVALIWLVRLGHHRLRPATVEISGASHE